jgi:hypothetical protein
MHGRSSGWHATAVVVLMAAAGGVSACETDDFGGLSGAVVTLVDSGPPLQSALAFVLPDTIIQLPNASFTMRHDADAEITAHIRSHLVSLGWRDAAGDATPVPDVVVLVAATARLQTGVFYTDWYGSWGYLPYWGPTVSTDWIWSSPAAVPYSFPAGTLLVTMIDLRDQDMTTRDIPLLWAAAVDGVIRGVSASASLAIIGLDQAFAQSAYLERTP